MSNEIAKEIIDRIKEEARGFIPQPAVARYDASVQGRDKVLWLTNIEGGSHVGVGAEHFGSGSDSGDCFPRSPSPASPPLLTLARAISLSP